MKHFIMDNDRELIAVDVDTGERIAIPRYAVWAIRRTHYDGVPTKDSKPLVIAVGAELQHLFEEHGVMPVFRFEELMDGETNDNDR